MTPHTFVRRTIGLYHGARHPLFPLPRRIYRGESRSISSQTEDLFARYLADILPDDTTLYINQIITSGAKASRYRVKPDVIVARGKQIVALFDLKMDLGYHRNDFLTFWSAKDRLMTSLHGLEFSLFRKEQSGKMPLRLTMCKQARLFFVLVSGQNINPNDLDSLLNHKGTMRNSNLFVLTRGSHPNIYGKTPKEAKALLTVVIEEFEALGAELDDLCSQVQA